MMDLIKRNYWWPGIKNDVKRYIQGCFKCQQNKVQHMKKAGELHSLKTPECCDNHLSQGQMITQGVNLLVRVSSGEFTRELDKEPLLN